MPDDITLKIEIEIKGIKYTWQSAPEYSCDHCALKSTCDEQEYFPCFNNIAEWTGHGFWIKKEELDR